jgi:PilZ domain-containing protein
MVLPFLFPRGNPRGIPNSAGCHRGRVSCGLETNMSERSDMPIVLPGPSPDEQANGGGPERRKQVRFPFTAAADVLDLRSQARVTGRCSDLGAGGCYIDTLSPFGVGTAVRVRIVCESRELDAQAVVTYAHVSMGMGLAFTEIKREGQDVLRSWIAGLAGEPPRDLAVSNSEAEGEAPEDNESLRLVINELITLLIRRKVITEKEGAGLLHQMFR